MVRPIRIALFAATALTAAPLLAQEAPAPASAAPSLEEQFQNPGNAARPRVWWHWMNGNITKDGIAKDMDWMSRVGIGGLQNFDANLMTPVAVKQRLIYMHPEWKDAFRFTAQEAERRGLELAIAASPGWSETGGPWVKPEDGLKKVVWSETRVAGGKPFKGKIATPPSTTGPFQTARTDGGIGAMFGDKPAEPPVAFGDIAVLAFPDAASSAPLPKVAVEGAATAADAAALADDDYGAGLDVPRGTPAKPPVILLTYDKPQTIRSARFFVPNSKSIFTGPAFDATLEASADGMAWTKVASLPVGEVPGTASFAPVTASQFRVVLKAADPSSTLNSLGATAPGVAMNFDIGEMMSKMTAPWSVRVLSLSAAPAIDHAEAKAGFSIALNYYELPQVNDGATGVAPGQVIDLTGKLKPDGTLDWTPPKGTNWRVLRFGWSLLGTTNHPAPAEATGLEVDKFDGPAVRRYLEHYIGMYRDASGGLIGKQGVRAILTDSIEVGAANWTPRMVDQFKRLRGYDPTPYFPALAGVLVGSRADSEKFLYDYRRTLADLMASEHYGTVAKVAHENGLRVYGEALEDHRPSLGDDMAMRSHADVPMAAMWTHSREQGPRLTYLADIKGAASVAHIYGQNLVAAESLTASMNPWNYAPNSLKRIIDLEFVNGVNRPVIHTSVHQPLDDKVPGFSLFIFGQYFNRHESWAEMAKPWVDYLSRNSLMLQAGRHYADVGYFYGEEAPLTGLYGDKRVADAPKTYAYDFVNFNALATGMVNDGSEVVTAGGARYKAIYLGGSSHRMTVAALKSLAALVEGGATVVGKAPESSPSLNDKAEDFAALVAKLWPGGDVATVGKGRVIASQDIEGSLAKIGVAPDFRSDAGDKLGFLHRRLTDGESYFLVNFDNAPVTTEARFRVTGKAPELWHAETGKSEPVSYRIENGETVVPLQFDAEQSFHVVFRKSAVADSLAIKKIVPVEAATLDGAWDVAFQANRGAPATAKFAQLEPLDKNSDPGIKYFSGEATYSRDFATPKGWKSGQPLWLDLGAVHELAEVSVNGQAAGAVWHAPYRLDIGAFAKPGKNRIAVKVANLWVNRLIGDAQKDAKPITWTAMPTYRADAPLRTSGLVGPVKLLVQGK